MAANRLPGITSVCIRVLPWLLFPLAPASAQQIPVIRVTSELVLVDVVVRDGRGSFVPNLTAADFQVFDQGKAQKITAFEAYRSGRPGSDSGRAAGVPGGPPANWMVILVDGVNTTFEASGLATDGLRKWLSTAPPGTPVMVASLNRSQVRVHVPFTTDYAEALETLKKVPVVAQLQQSVEEVEAEIQRVLSRSALGEARGVDRQGLDNAVRLAAGFARVTEELTGETTSAFRRFLATLGGYPGRKNLVYLTAGYPLRPGQRLINFVRRQSGAEDSRDSGDRQVASMALGQIPQVDVTEALRELATTANSYGVSLYPIDSRGLIAVAPGQAPASGLAPADIESQIEQISEPQTTIILLASLTGGLPTFNTNGLEAGIRRAAEEVGDYYLLGFRPETDKQPKFHSLQVKLAKQADYRIRSRRGYHSGLSDEQRINTAVAAALAMLEAATAIPFASRVAVNGQNVAVDVAIPVDGVRFAPLPSGVRCQLQLLGLVTKADGSRVGKDYQVNRSYNLELNPEQFKQVQAQQSVVTRNEFTLPSGQYQLTLVLRDIATGAIGARREKVEVK